MARYCAQPGGVSVTTADPDSADRGARQIVLMLPDATRYGDGLVDETIAIELDEPTARHLARLLADATRDERTAAQDVLAGSAHRIERSGLAPLTFRGRVLATASSESVRGERQNRWHEITVYRTDGGRYVAGVSHRTKWEGEASSHFAAVCGTLAEVGSYIGDHDPLCDMLGYPPGAQYDARRDRLRAELLAGWREIVSEVLTAIGAVEAID